MKRKRIIILIIFISLLLFFLPFFLSKETNENVISGINIISGFASLLTLAVALLLYNRFGIEKSLLDKQTNEVFELLENLNKAFIFIQGNNIVMRFNPTRPYHKIYESHYDKMLLFSPTYMEGLGNIWKHSNNIFLPKDIAKRLNKLQIYLLAKQSDKLEDHQLRVYVPTKENEKEYFGVANNKEIIFMEFLTNWNELVEEIKSWISMNSSMKSELNLE